jgi:hypothetical protein
MDHLELLSLQKNVLKQTSDIDWYLRRNSSKGILEE